MTHHLVTYISLIQRKGTETKRKTVKEDPWNQHPAVLHNHWGKHKHESILFWNKGWIPACFFFFFFFPHFQRFLFYCSVLRRAQRQTPARALEGVLDVFVLRNLFSNPPPFFFFYFTNSYQVESARVLFFFFSSFLNCNYVVSRRTQRSLQNGYCSAHLSLGFKYQCCVTAEVRGSSGRENTKHEKRGDCWSGLMAWRALVKWCLTNLLSECCQCFYRTVMDCTYGFFPSVCGCLSVCERVQARP